MILIPVRGIIRNIIAMKIHITVKQLELTPSIRAYIDNKFGSLSRALGAFDKGGEGVSVLVEVERSTKHHRHGDVFSAAAVLEIRKKIIRAESTADDLRVAISDTKDKLSREIKKQKTRLLAVRRA